MSTSIVAIDSRARINKIMLAAAVLVAAFAMLFLPHTGRAAAAPGDSPSASSVESGSSSSQPAYPPVFDCPTSAVTVAQQPNAVAPAAAVCATGSTTSVHVAGQSAKRVPASKTTGKLASTGVPVATYAGLGLAFLIGGGIIVAAGRRGRRS